MAISGLIPKSFDSMQIDAGAFFVGLDTSSITTLAQLKTAIATALENDDNRLGATIGGGTFSIVPETRVIEADGMRYAIKGSMVFDTYEVKLTTTLKELMPQNWKNIVPTTEITTEGEIQKIKFRTNLGNDDYIDEMFWVGKILNGRYMLIKLFNALNTVGATLTFQDKGEGSIPVEYAGHVSTLADMDYAPVEIWYFDNLSQVSLGAF